jgi:hypothetical protein
VLDTLCIAVADTRTEERMRIQSLNKFGIASADLKSLGRRRITLPKGKFSRRGFGKSAATAALTAIAHPSTGAQIEDPHASVDDEQSNEPDLTPLQMQEVEAWFKETVRRYGDRLSDEQRSRIRRILVQNQRMLAAIRNFPVDNGDAPATTLKPRVED